MFNPESLIIFILACFVGYYVVLKVTPALHAPLMSVTNAISSVIIVVAIYAATETTFVVAYRASTSWLGIIAVFLTAINIVGGFMLTRRMLAMFAKKKKEGDK